MTAEPRSTRRQRARMAAVTRWTVIAGALALATAHYWTR